MKKLISLLASVLISLPSLAATYRIDTEGAHAFIVFKIPHLGYSMLLGQFEKFSGEFTYDADNIEASTIAVTVDTTSLDSNHAERDKHLKSDDYLNTKKYSSATFRSTAVQATGDDGLQVAGELTLHGVTRSIVIDAKKVGEGPDPWGGYRAGFSGTTTLSLQDFNIPYEKLGPSAAHVEMELHIEGIRQSN